LEHTSSFMALTLTFIWHDFIWKTCVETHMCDVEPTQFTFNSNVEQWRLVFAPLCCRLALIKRIWLSNPLNTFIRLLPALITWIFALLHHRPPFFPFVAALEHSHLSPTDSQLFSFQWTPLTASTLWSSVLMMCLRSVCKHPHKTATEDLWYDSIYRGRVYRRTNWEQREERLWWKGEEGASMGVFGRGSYTWPTNDAVSSLNVWFVVMCELYLVWY